MNEKNLYILGEHVQIKIIGDLQNFDEESFEIF